MKKITYLASLAVLLIASCEQKTVKKEEKPKIKIGPELAVKCAKIEVLNQLANPLNTLVEADTVTTINDTLFNIVGHFITPTEKVFFKCDIALTRDGNSYQMDKITIK